MHGQSSGHPKIIIFIHFLTLNSSDCYKKRHFNAKFTGVSMINASSGLVSFFRKSAIFQQGIIVFQSNSSFFNQIHRFSIGNHDIKADLIIFSTGVILSMTTFQIHHFECKISRKTAGKQHKNALL